VRIYANSDYLDGQSYRRRGLGEPLESSRGRWLVVVVNYKQARVSRRWYGEVVTVSFATNLPPDDERVY
jgi:hypothetical protein